MYDIWAYNKRRNAMFRLSWRAEKVGNRVYENAHMPAGWRTRQAADKWARANPHRVPYGFMVLKRDED